MTSTQFWDKTFSASSESWDVEGTILLAVNEAATYFGAMQGKKLIDLGCGRGTTSIFFARLGASVISIDQSEVAIEKLREHSRKNGLSNIQAIVGDVNNISALGPVDFIFGSMILHHVEPFDTFAAALYETVRPGGRCFFFENNASSKSLMWLRTHVVGKFGVPKYGDHEEHPLTSDKLSALRRYFNVRQVFPYLMFFHLASVYLFRRRLGNFCDSADRMAYKIPRLRKYSYRQYVYMARGVA